MLVTEGCVASPSTPSSQNLPSPTTHLSEQPALQMYAIELDISKTMAELKAKAGEALGLNLTNYEVMVLSERRLAPDDTLQQQCSTEAGVVQVHFVVKQEEGSEGGAGLLNILDVLKPQEAATPASPRPDPQPPPPTQGGKRAKTTRWIVCPTFRELQKALKIPQNPQDWTPSHVRHWLSWAVRQFGLKGLKPTSPDWSLTGRQLVALTQADFQHLAPHDPGDVFYMHFELLRRTNVVAVVCDPSSSVPRPAPPKVTSPTRGQVISRTTAAQVQGEAVQIPQRAATTSGTQQIQLWQFLLELLTDPKLQEVISWFGSDGEFRLHQPEVVAALWGQRKGKPNMNYEKLSRALRYYYDGDMIAKVSGKRFVYRFVLDLRVVVGYSAGQLRAQVEACPTTPRPSTAPPHS